MFLWQLGITSLQSNDPMNQFMLNLQKPTSMVFITSLFGLSRVGFVSNHRGRLTTGPTMHRILLLAFLLLLVGCEKQIDPLPSPPDGVIAIGTEANEMGSAITNKIGGGYWAAIGVERSQGDWDATILELDDLGEVLREVGFQNEGESEAVRCLRLDAAGQLLVASVVQSKGEAQVYFRLRILNDNLQVVDRHEFGELALGEFGPYTGGSSHMEVFELPQGGWFVVVQQGYIQKAYRLDSGGALIAETNLSTENEYPNFPVHNLVQDSLGQLYRLRVSNSYYVLNIEIQHLDQSGSPLSTQPIQLDSAFLADYYSVVEAAALCFAPNGKMIASIHRAEGLQDVFAFNPQNGIIDWHRVLSFPEHLHLLAIGDTNNLLFAGHSARFGFDASLGSQDCTVGMIGTDGTNFRRRTIGGRGTEILNGITPNPSGGMVAIGSSSSFGSGGFDAVLVFYP